MISVIMLTYNRESLVSRAIESILAQTYRDFEFIMVDNGSTDHSGQIAEEYSRKDGRLRVIHQKRGNIGAGRNTGLDAARGEYFTFIDDDDWADPDMLEFLLSLAEEHDAGAAICGAADKALDEKLVMTAEEALIELMWRRRYSTGFPMKLFRREAAVGCRFSEEDRYDDIGVIYRVFSRAGTVVYHGLPKYHVLRHPGNNSAWTTDHSLLNARTLNEYLTAYRVRTEWLSEKFPASAPAWRYFEWSFMLSMVEKIHRFGLGECGEQLAAMTEELRRHRSMFLSSPELLEFERKWVEQYIEEPSPQNE